MKKSVKAVIFDFGNVITLPPIQTNIKRMQVACNLSAERFENEYRKNRPDFDRGKIDGREFWSRILKAGKVRPASEKLKSLIDEDIKAWTRINYPIITWAKSLRQNGYKTAILSNMPKDIGEHIIENFSWIKEFDVIVFSCDVGIIKPEFMIYQFCLKELGLLSGDTLFIDDSYDNVKAAEQIGINGLVFQSLEETARVLNNNYDVPVLMT